MENRVDLMIFGATGYTGKFLVRELASTYKNEVFTWAVAGRSESRLKDLIQSVSKEKGVDLSHIKLFVVNADDTNSVKDMCQNARILINCVGPYRFTGEAIVKQCVSAGTHHIDVSGEPEFLESVHLKYNTEAVEKNVFVIGSCGFDSVPADIGVVYTQNMFKNDLEYVESYLSFECEKPVYFNYATWESAVYGFANAKNLSKIRKELFKNRLPKPAHPAPKKQGRFGYFTDSFLKKYCFDFMGSDKSVVQRTQYFNYETLNMRTIQYMPYFTIQSYWSVLKMILFGINFGVMANYRFGRYLLLKFHGFFSGGLAKKLDSNKIEAEQNDGRFINQFRGYGHSTKLENKNEVHSEKPDQLIVTEMSGPEGYTSTALLVLDCAFTLLQEQEKIPVKGGVLTPAAAFAKTSIIDRLVQHGMKFDVLYHGQIDQFNK